MLGAYLSTAAIVLGALALGRGALGLAGWHERLWLSGPVGLAVGLTVSGIVIRLGDGLAVAIALALALLLAVVAWGRTGTGLRTRIRAARVLVRGPPGPDPRARGPGGAGRSLPASRSAAGEAAPRQDPCRAATDEEAGGRPAPETKDPWRVWVSAAAGAAALLAASIPFAANGRVDVLGAGLVNDDMASHLAFASWLDTGVGEEPFLLADGYPVGPHGLVAALANAVPGTGPVEGFVALALAVPVLTAIAAAGALGHLRPLPRTAAAALVALPYLGAAWLAQHAFKEPILALLLLAFALAMPAARAARSALPLALLAAGVVYAYSFPGLAWPAAAAGIWTLAMLPGRSRVEVRRLAAGPALAAVVATLLLIAPEAGPMLDFTDFRALSPETANEGGLGNLPGQISPLEALGVWPSGEFRLDPGEGGAPAVAFYAGAALGALALALGLAAWVRRHGAAIPAALGAGVLAYLAALVLGTPYTSAKALAVLAPPVMLVALGGLLGRRGRGAATLALAFAACAAASSFVVLREAVVAPDEHRSELARIRPAVRGSEVLFLGRDNFVAWELRGARVATHVRNFYNELRVPANPRVEAAGLKFGFDAVAPAVLERFGHVLTTRGSYASAPPPSLAAVERTESYVLWERTREVGPRRTLDEGAAPGAVLGCDTGAAPGPIGGPAALWPRRPVATARWEPSATLESGAAAVAELRLPAGEWELSLVYDATRELTLAAPEQGFRSVLPPNLDFRGPGPHWPAGRLTVAGGGAVRIEARVADPPAAGRLLGARAVAHLGRIAATPVSAVEARAARRPGDRPAGGAAHLIRATAPYPGDAAALGSGARCGGYVDWLGPQPP